MKILIFSDGSKGGAEGIAFSQAGELKRLGHDVRVATAESLPKYHERWRNWRMLYNPAGIVLAKREIASFKPEIIHAHNIHNKFSYAILRLAKKSGARVFLTAHDTYFFYPGKYLGKSGFWHEIMVQKLRYNPFRNCVIKTYLKYVDRIFAVSSALGEVLNIHKISNTVLHNGIDINKWHAEKSSIEAREAGDGVGERESTVLFAGRYSALKGALVMPQIEAKVREKVRDVEFVYLGRDKWIPQEEVPAVYAKADVLVVPSVYLDPFPTVVLEAGAASLPVVVTNMGGAKEAVLDGKTGYVADPYLPDFANRVTELLLDKSKAKMFGEGARKHISRNFSLTSQVAKLVEYYKMN